jgi:hypothetical protein
MAVKDKDNKALSFDKPDGRAQINTVVNGCRVRLNFARTADGGRMSDIKKMILGGLSKL